MFAFVRRCAEPITQACWLKVKVTVKGHEFEPWISCSLYISWTLWKIFIKFGSNVRLSEMMCRTHNSTMQTQGQGHNWRPPVWALNFEAAPLSFCGGGYSCPSDCLVVFFVSPTVLMIRGSNPLLGQNSLLCPQLRRSWSGILLLGCS